MADAVRVPEGGNLRLISEIVLVNIENDSEVMVEFFTSKGIPWTVDLGTEGTDSRFNLTLLRGKQTVLTSAGQGPIEVGYARVSAGPGVNGTAILRGIDLPSGIALFEAGVPPASLYRDFSVVLDSEGIYDTGVALLSPPLIQRPDISQAVPATVVIRLYDEDYHPLAEETFQLKRGEYRPRFVYEFFSDPTVSSTAREMRGILTIQSDQELAALTLRQGNDPAGSFPESVSTLTVFPVIPGRPEVSASPLSENR